MACSALWSPSRLQLITSDLCGAPSSAAAASAGRWRRAPPAAAAAQRQLGAALHALPPDTAASSAAVAAPAPGFEQLFAGLAGVLAPSAAVAAGATERGRGLVASRDVPAGAPLLSGERAWAFH